MHLPTFKWTSSFLYEIITRKKRYTNILLLQPNDKYKVVKRKPAVRNYWVRPGKDRYWWENFTSRKVVEEEWREISECQGKRFKFFAQNCILIFLRMTPGFETRSQLVIKLRDFALFALILLQYLVLII